jgi:hypothetical protein
LALDRFEASDVAFDLSAGPWARDSGGHGILVGLDASGKGSELGASINLSTFCG